MTYRPGLAPCMRYGLQIATACLLENSAAVSYIEGESKWRIVTVPATKSDLYTSVRPALPQLSQIAGSASSGHRVFKSDGYLKKTWVFQVPSTREVCFMFCES